jgi:hypothetical protein
MRLADGERQGSVLKKISCFAKNFLTVHTISDMMPRYKTGSEPFEQDLGALCDCRPARDLRRFA